LTVYIDALQHCIDLSVYCAGKTTVPEDEAWDPEAFPDLERFHD
jgi:hypothetical protein